jgi:hypothetical protein
MEKLQKKLYICKLVFKSVLMHNALIIYSNINLTTYFRTRHRALDLGNEGYSWVLPATGNAHSGSYSAVYNNSTANSHGDWLFSRCFELTAGETYEVSF